ncbi:hypothetical protein TrVE_jg10326 [Triparma verrucosa]|uniref:S-adenosylmethionine-dependent methyltransferase domain-containing protein n=1 Tax=Triparma verrucosa TaxID=1606542 RepID=A0A9W7EX74_9STRA|nr:hypothetical protein TrVE_jg10326 [Triparma verrucosa]
MPTSIAFLLLSTLLLSFTFHASGLTLIQLPRNKRTLTFRSGQQLIYRNSLSSASLPPTLKTGDICLLKTFPDPQGQYDDIGIGVYNEESMYAIRILAHHNSELYKTLEGGELTDEEIVYSIFSRKLRAAQSSRLSLGLPSPSTDSYRLLNGEGDGLSGLSLDVYGPTLTVAMSSAAYVEIHKETIMRCLKDVLECEDVVWKRTENRLMQDGFVGEEEEEVVVERKEQNIILENGIKYYIQPVGSQKTGFYTDQRSNRELVSGLAEGKTVLDLCCFVGAFSLNAAVNGGAKKCTGVDSSKDAVAAAQENAELNGVDNCEFIAMGIEAYMKDAISRGLEYDIVILDPPKLAPTVKSLERASRKYHALNRDALKLVNKKSGGVLMTCTCSSAMSTMNGGQYFLNTIQRASLAAGREITLHGRSHAAACHSTSPLEGSSNYLTAALIGVAAEE